MNRDFLSNFERSEIRPKTEKADEIVTVSDEVEYRENEFPQNICFIWPEGSRHFIEYSRLDSGKISVEYNTINLMFGGETVELVGIRLLPIFNSIMLHKRRYIHCDDERYNDLVDDDLPIVNQVIILKNS